MERWSCWKRRRDRPSVRQRASRHIWSRGEQSWWKLWAKWTNCPGAHQMSISCRCKTYQIFKIVKKYVETVPRRCETISVRHLIWSGISTGCSLRQRVYFGCLPVCWQCTQSRHWAISPISRWKVLDQRKEVACYLTASFHIMTLDTCVPGVLGVEERNDRCMSAYCAHQPHGPSNHLCPSSGWCYTGAVWPDSFHLQGKK